MSDEKSFGKLSYLIGKTNTTAQKGKGDMVDSTTTFMVQLDNCIVIVKNIPCHKCSQCGEESFSFEVTQRLEKIVDKFKEALTEIAVVNYTAA